MKPTTDVIRKDLCEIATEMVSDWGLDLPEIGGATRLSQDLCFSSIDLLNFLASIDVRYQRKLPYESLIMEGSVYRADLTLDELAEFVNEEFDNGTPMSSTL